MDFHGPRATGRHQEWFFSTIIVKTNALLPGIYIRITAICKSKNINIVVLQTQQEVCKKYEKNEQT